MACYHDAAARYCDAKVRGEVFAHFHAFAIERHVELN
jgi:hypothetical protein